MACTTINSMLKSCSNNQGGVVAAYINDTSNVTGMTIGATSHEITGLTASPVYSTYQFNRNVGNITVDPKIDLISGSTYYEAKVTLVFHRREAAKSRSLQILAEGQRFLDIIFLDANGIYWYIDHAQVDGGTEETGTTRGDGSKYTVTFIANMDNRPYTVLASIVPALIT